MTEWSVIKKLHLGITNICLPRSPDVSILYNLDKELNSIQKIKNNLMSNNYLFIDNDYPYEFISNVSHKVFWFNDLYNYSQEEALDICIKQLKQVNFQYVDIVIMCNDIFRKSVSDINHYHVFILKN